MGCSVGLILIAKNKKTKRKCKQTHMQNSILDMLFGMYASMGCGPVGFGPRYYTPRRIKYNAAHRACWLNDYRWTPSLYRGEFQLMRVKPEYEQRTKLHSSCCYLCVRRHRRIISSIHTRFGTHTAPISHFFLSSFSTFRFIAHRWLRPIRTVKNGKSKVCAMCLLSEMVLANKAINSFFRKERRKKMNKTVYLNALEWVLQLHAIQCIRLRSRVQTVITVI